jgi:hypothetical protein
VEEQPNEITMVLQDIFLSLNLDEEEEIEEELHVQIDYNLRSKGHI